MEKGVLAAISSSRSDYKFGFPLSIRLLQGQFCGTISLLPTVNGSPNEVTIKHKMAMQGTRTTTNKIVNFQPTFHFYYWLNLYCNTLLNKSLRSINPLCND
jgi:hypothetical protein